MKIAYFIDNLRGDGTQRVLTQLAQGLAKRGHKQTVVCLNNSCDELLINELQSIPVDVRVVGKMALVSGYGLVSTWIWLSRERFDAVVTMLFAADVIGRSLAWCSRVPRVISSLRARNVHYSRAQRWLVRATMNLADAVIINSPHTREFAIRVEGVPPDHIAVIYNGVRVENYAGSVDQLSRRDDLGLPKHGWLLGSVGRLTKQKGVDVLLHALCLIGVSDFNLLIVGIGAEEAKLRALAIKLGLSARVHFVGYRHDLPKILGVLDLYVHAARFEGMPNAVLEAMAAACPIVATAVDGNRELIEDGKHGWLVPPESPEELAKAIDEALSDSNEAHRRGAMARKRAHNDFSVDSMVDAWESILVTGKLNSERSGSFYRYVE